MQKYHYSSTNSTYSNSFARFNLPLMRIVRSRSALSEQLNAIKSDGESVGFVPTMGALHSGHLALVKHAALENNHVVISIFVNPTQFNNPEDLKKYPRDVDADIKKLEELQDVILFLPAVSDLYPKEVRSKLIDLNGLDKVMEGEFRPGHFDGVATVVSKFFEIVQPTRAYFGEKDFQQLQIIRLISKNQFPGIQIIGHPVERNRDGLALSSRNQLLSQEDQKKALLIFQNLNWAKLQVPKLSPDTISHSIIQNFEGSALEIEYVQIVNEDTLQKIDSWEDVKSARIFIAAHISGVRLIDNVSLF